MVAFELNCHFLTLRSSICIQVLEMVSEKSFNSAGLLLCFSRSCVDQRKVLNIYKAKSEVWAIEVSLHGQPLIPSSRVRMVSVVDVSVKEDVTDSRLCQNAGDLRTVSRNTS
jgi:hypothetical protein